jgi:FixJ family two-component response regulator
VRLVVQRLRISMSDDEPTVFVVDDDISIRESVEGILDSIGLRAETFESAQEFLKHGRLAGPNCLVLDVRLPGLSGLDFQTELAKANIQIPIVFITGFADVPMTVRAMKAGAVEFLTKPFRDQELLDAIQLALERDRLQLLDRAERDELRRRLETLTDRERQVMALVVGGKLNREIATELGTSEVTVKVHRGQVMRKMRAESVIDLARMARLAGSA